MTGLFLFDCISEPVLCPSCRVQSAAHKNSTSGETLSMPVKQTVALWFSTGGCYSAVLHPLLITAGSYTVSCSASLVQLFQSWLFKARWIEQGQGTLGLYQACACNTTKLHHCMTGSTIPRLRHAKLGRGLEIYNLFCWFMTKATV